MSFPVPSWLAPVVDAAINYQPMQVIWGDDDASLTARNAANTARFLSLQDAWREALARLNEDTGAIQVTDEDWSRWLVEGGNTTANYLAWLEADVPIEVPLPDTVLKMANTVTVCAQSFEHPRSAASVNAYQIDLARPNIRPMEVNAAVDAPNIVEQIYEWASARLVFLGLLAVDANRIDKWTQWRYDGGTRDPIFLGWLEDREQLGDQERPAPVTPDEPDTVALPPTPPTVRLGWTIPTVSTTGQFERAQIYILPEAPAAAERVQSLEARIHRTRLVGGAPGTPEQVREVRLPAGRTTCAPANLASAEYLEVVTRNVGSTVAQTICTYAPTGGSQSTTVTRRIPASGTTRTGPDCSSLVAQLRADNPGASVLIQSGTLTTTVAVDCTYQVPARLARSRSVRFSSALPTRDMEYPEQDGEIIREFSCTYGTEVLTATTSLLDPAVWVSTGDGWGAAQEREIPGDLPIRYRQDNLATLSANTPWLDAFGNCATEYNGTALTGLSLIQSGIYRVRPAAATTRQTTYQGRAGASASAICTENSIIGERVTSAAEVREYVLNCVYSIAAGGITPDRVQTLTGDVSCPPARSGEDEPIRQVVQTPGDDVQGITCRYITPEIRPVAPFEITVSDRRYYFPYDGSQRTVTRLLDFTAAEALTADANHDIEFRWRNAAGFSAPSTVVLPSIGPFPIYGAQSIPEPVWINRNVNPDGRGANQVVLLVAANYQSTSIPGDSWRFTETVTLTEDRATAPWTTQFTLNQGNPAQYIAPPPEVIARRNKIRWSSVQDSRTPAAQKRTITFTIDPPIDPFPTAAELPPIALAQIGSTSPNVTAANSLVDSGIDLPADYAQNVYIASTGPGGRSPAIAWHGADLPTDGAAGSTGTGSLTIASENEHDGAPLTYLRTDINRDLFTGVSSTTAGLLRPLTVFEWDGIEQLGTDQNIDFTDMNYVDTGIVLPADYATALLVARFGGEQGGMDIQPGGLITVGGVVGQPGPGLEFNIVQGATGNVRRYVAAIDSTTDRRLLLRTLDTTADANPLQVYTVTRPTVIGSIAGRNWPGTSQLVETGIDLPDDYNTAMFIVSWQGANLIWGGDLQESTVGSTPTSGPLYARVSGRRQWLAVSSGGNLLAAAEAAVTAAPMDVWRID